MSTSCIIALVEGTNAILLEKTHDGFEETVKFLINTAVANEDLDAENIANYLVKNTDVRLSLYVHKYPSYMAIFDTMDSKFQWIQVDPYLKKVEEYKKYLAVSNG